MSATIANPEAAAEARDELLKQTQPTTEASADSAAAQAEVLYGDDPECIELSVAGETILADPIGLGRRARLMKQATEADERGDEMAQIEAVLDMIDTLVDATPDAYDTDWWDNRSQSQVRGAFQTLSAESAGGNE